MADIELEHLAEQYAPNSKVGVHLSSKYLPIESGTFLKPITEATLERVIERHFDTGFIIISANRAEGIALDKRGHKKLRTRADNVSAYKHILADVSESPFGFLPVWGGYREKGVDRDSINPEPSFLVFPMKSGKPRGDTNTFDSLLDFGLQMIRKYNQEVVLVRFPPNYSDLAKAGKNLFLNKDGVVSSRVEDIPEWNDLEQEYYTADRRRSAGGIGSITKWMKGKDPATDVERFNRIGRDQHFHPPMSEDEPYPPERFSFPVVKASTKDNRLDESYGFYLESPSQTYNVAMMRHYSGYDKTLCEVLPWYRGRTGSV